MAFCYVLRRKTSLHAHRQSFLQLFFSQQTAGKFFSGMESSRRLKPPVILRESQRGWKPRPFKARAIQEFFGGLLDACRCRWQQDNLLLVCSSHNLEKIAQGRIVFLIQKQKVPAQFPSQM